MSGVATGLIIGVIASLILIASIVEGSRDGCRAANPGFDCDIGWVRGEAFQ